MGYERSLPSTTPDHLVNLEIEAALLGAMLRAPRTIDDIEGRVYPRDFASFEHSRIFEILVNLYFRGVDLGPDRLGHIVSAAPELEDIGGRQYLVELAANIVTVVNAKDYADTIAELSARRDLILLADDLKLIARDTTDELETRDGVLDRAEQQFTDTVVREDQACSHLQPAQQIAESELETFLHEYENGVSRGVLTGFVELDQIMRGLYPSDLIIVAGRPSMGKSAFALSLALSAANREKKVALFSPEMDASQIVERIVSQHSGVPGNRIRDRDVYEEELPRVVDGYRIASGTSLWIDESSALTVPAIRREARRLKRRGGLDLLMIDYLQLLSGSEQSKRSGRVAEVSEITRELKILAKDLGVPVVLLSQLNREVEKRDDKRPNLADLRDSGSIEQDADVVTFLYRPEYYLREPEQKPEEAEGSYLERRADFDNYREQVKGQVEVIVSKNRHGPTDTASLTFEKEIGRFF